MVRAVVDRVDTHGVDIQLLKPFLPGQQCSEQDIINPRTP